MSSATHSRREPHGLVWTRYASMPLYTKMFRRSGFVDEMEGVAEAAAQGDQVRSVTWISDRLMDEVCLVGPLSRCQEHLTAFREAGVDEAIIAPQAVKEDHAAAVRQLLEAFSPR